ncbi:transcriptional regulator [Acidovorax lacteus]|uniref:Cro/Cl family transcriptional regulator n=1 Tax=Acidovorax lacteus TaxID=1924988 RepID=A0ABP8L1S1_9BURK
MLLATYFSANRGSQADLARALGVTQSLPSAWAAIDPKKRRPVPVRYCIAIERATDGAVTRRDLRPDDWHLIWPELAAADSPPNSPAVLGNQARAAIKIVAQEVANA